MKRSKTVSTVHKPRRRGSQRNCVTQVCRVPATKTTQAKRKRGGETINNLLPRVPMSRPTKSKTTDQEKLVTQPGAVSGAPRTKKVRGATSSPSVSKRKAGRDQGDSVTRYVPVSPTTSARHSALVTQKQSVSSATVRKLRTVATNKIDAKRKPASGRGRHVVVTHETNASPTHSADQAAHVTQTAVVGRRRSSRPTAIPPELIRRIVSMHRERRGLMLTRGNILRQIHAEERWVAAARIKAEGKLIGREFPKPTDADVAAVRTLRGSYYQILQGPPTLAKDARLEERGVIGLEKITEIELAKYVQQLPAPIIEFVDNTRGFGRPSLAVIIGEAGDLANYDTPARLWKRLGLAVINGKSQRKTKDKKEAEIQGYNPKRRSQMFVIADSLIKASGPYTDLYRERKQYEIDKLAAMGIEVVPGEQLKRAKDKTKLMSKGHVDKRARRFTEKRFILDLWRVWRRATGHRAY